MTFMKINALLVVGLTTFISSATLAFAAGDPAKVGGPEKCADCHKNETAAWQEMKHFKTFDDLHRRPAAKEIAGKLEIANIKTEGTCMQCHYTANPAGRAVAGVSCESCHGPSGDWLTVHNEKGKRAEAEGLGFISPNNIYQLASNCFSCHTVPNEKLVNVGGHQAGSPIELVSWVQGEVRHHFKSSKDNADATPERKRMLYLVGRVVDLEYSLRGVANATEKATYAVTMARRAKARGDRKGEQSLVGADVEKGAGVAGQRAREIERRAFGQDLVRRSVKQMMLAGRQQQAQSAGDAEIGLDELRVIPPANENRRDDPVDRRRLQRGWRQRRAPRQQAEPRQGGEGSGDGAAGLRREGGVAVRGPGHVVNPASEARGGADAARPEK